MQETVSVTGMVLKTEPIGDYDRRVVILSGEKGKIAAFAKGARRQGSRLLAATNPFCFGKFDLYVGRNSYTIIEATIQNYFAGLREDYEAAFYGMYFLEVMDYYTQENNDERKMLNLLYQSLKALGHQTLDHRLVRYIFEIKALVLNGEYPGIPYRKGAGETAATSPEKMTEVADWVDATVYTVDYIANTGIEKLYTFTVSAEVLAELQAIAAIYRQKFIDRPFKSLEILAALATE